MAIVIATGSNLGNSIQTLINAKLELQKHFELIEESRIYLSKAQDYIHQPDFYNQVLVLGLPQFSPDSSTEVTPQYVLKVLQNIETQFGRTREVDKGPRTLDLDLLFFKNLRLKTPELEIPHPRLFQRSFVMLPLSELKIYHDLSTSFHFSILDKWKLEATPVE